MGDHGFHNFDEQHQLGDGSIYEDGVGTRRAIKDVSRILCDTNGWLKFNAENSRVWVPFQTKLNISLDGASDYIAYCGCALADGTSWLAVWKYRQLNTFYQPSSQTVQISVKGNYTNSYLTTSKFTISQTQYTSGTVYNRNVQPYVPYTVNYYTGSSYLPTPTTMTGLTSSFDGVNTVFTIPDVTENPRFIRLQQE